MAIESFWRLGKNTLALDPSWPLAPRGTLEHIILPGWPFSCSAECSEERPTTSVANARGLDTIKGSGKTSNKAMGMRVWVNMAKAFPATSRGRTFASSANSALKALNATTGFLAYVWKPFHVSLGCLKAMLSHDYWFRLVDHSLIFTNNVSYYLIFLR
jgi:hypothetical protein